LATDKASKGGCFRRYQNMGACSLHPNKTIVGCCLVYRVKDDTNGTIDHYKARLVAKDYTLTFFAWIVVKLLRFGLINHSTT